MHLLKESERVIFWTINYYGIFIISKVIGMLVLHLVFELDNPVKL